MELCHMSPTKTVSASSDSKALWDQARAEILSAIDVKAEFISWGCKLSGEPNEAGWVACFALGREQARPDPGRGGSQAGAGADRHGPHRGRYRDFGDPSIDGSMSFFYAAARFGGYVRHKLAQDHYAAIAGVKLPSTEDSKDW